MLLKELTFREYYHQYVVVEADALTSMLKGAGQASERDCFMLCSSFIDDRGRLQFHVLSMGDAWDHCDRGLFLHAVLGIFDPFRLRNLRVKCIHPSARMEMKNQYFLARMEKNASAALKRTREEKRLDNLRDDFYPDVVAAGILESDGIHEYPMYLRCLDGTFAVGRLLESSRQGAYVKGETLYALPYVTGDEIHLLTVFHGPLSQTQKQSERNLAAQAEAIGYGFSGSDWKAA